jgi:IS30 family transposase
MIRQYFTKGSRFGNITDMDVGTVMHKLKPRPHITLNYQTTHAIFLLMRPKCQKKGFALRQSLTAWALSEIFQY